MGSTAGEVESRTAARIENHIEDTREHLGQNLRELELKVRSATDWRQQYENHPAAFLGVAFGGGLLLGAAFGGSRGSQHSSSTFPATDAGEPMGRREVVSYAPSRSKVAALQSWEIIKAALVGVAAARLKDYIDQLIPGFSAQYREAAAERKR